METHPAWLKRSRIPLTIVCGPPCSGKTTYVRGCAADGDTVIDLDLIRRRLHPGFRAWGSNSEDYKLLRRALRIRNLMLGRLSALTSGRAYFIVAAPTETEREWWKKQLGGVVVLLNPGAQECRRRALARGTPLAAVGVDQWYARSERHWHPPTYRKAIGTDGWFDEGDEADRELDDALK